MESFTLYAQFNWLLLFLLLCDRVEEGVFLQMPMHTLKVQKTRLQRVFPNSALMLDLSEMFLGLLITVANQIFLCNVF